MAVVVVTPPAEEPLTTAEAKAHLRVDNALDDALITSLIIAAREFCEKRQNRSYITQTLRYSLDAFPVAERVIEVPRPPLVSVSAITYKDDAGTVTTLGASTYAVDTDSFVGRIALMPSASWPSFTPYPVNAVSIMVVAGYGNASKVPQRVKQAILLLVAHWYENRETIFVGTISKQLEFTVDALLGIDRVYW